MFRLRAKVAKGDNSHPYSPCTSLRPDSGASVGFKMYQGLSLKNVKLHCNMVASTDIHTSIHICTSQVTYINILLDLLYT